MTPINHEDGPIVRGIKLDDHRFLGRMRTRQLLNVAKDPRSTENERAVEASSELSTLRRIRLEVQRLFAGAKAKNVPAYAKYIVNVAEGEPGMAPPIILYSAEPLIEDPGDETIIQIPFAAPLVAIDGETQLAARFEAADMSEVTHNDAVPVVICHGRSLDWARQVFHDLNLLGVRPNAAIGISMDERDPLTQVARNLEHKVPFLKNRVNTVRRQLRKSDPEVVTITALRGSVVCFAEGIGGVKYGARPVSIDKDRIPEIETVAATWYTAAFDLLGPAIEDRENKVCAAPAVLAAIGAMGHRLVDLNPSARSAEIDQLVAHLKAVNWSKGDHWAGIAGKYTPRGKFSIGGSKETAYACYAALTDQTSDGFLRVRATNRSAS